MPGVDDGAKVGFRPAPVQLPGGLEGADRVVPSLDDRRGQVPNPIDVAEQLILLLEKPTVHEVVSLYQCEG